MRNLINIMEAAQQAVGPGDVSYYMLEGCGIFAIALSRALPGGQIGILSRKNGEEYSDQIPYEVTHVFYWLNNQAYDAKGQRSFSAMAGDFEMTDGDFDLKGPWSPSRFKSQMMGNSDDAPLYGGSGEISQAVRLIRRHAAFYGLAQPKKPSDKPPSPSQNAEED